MHKDIENIVRKMLVYKKIIKCNREYNECFRFVNYLSCKSSMYLLNIRRINTNYRKVIICFKTGKQTKYEVPKNYF